MKRACLLACTLIFAACASNVRPVAVNAGDTCFRCRQVIVDTEYAAEVIDAGMHAYKFRTPGCLAQYLNDHPSELLGTFVTDFASKKLIRADRATFVPVILNDRTMERDYAAFRQSNQATLHAQKVGAERTFEWADVLSERAQAGSTN